MDAQACVKLAAWEALHSNMRMHVDAQGIPLEENGEGDIPPYGSGYPKDKRGLRSREWVQPRQFQPDPKRKAQQRVEPKKRAGR